MSFTVPGPDNSKKPGDITTSGQKRGAGPKDPVDDTDVTTDAVARPSARRNRRTPAADQDATTDLPADDDASDADVEDNDVVDADDVDETDDADDKPEAVDEPAEVVAPAPKLPEVIDTVPAAQSSGSHGLFGIRGTGDTSGFSGLARAGGTGIPVQSSARPYGGYFDDVANAIAAAYPNWSTAHIATIVDRGEITFYVHKEHIAKLSQVLRDTQSLRFELLASLSGVDYLRPDDGISSSADPQAAQYADQRLHVVYHYASLTYRRRIRVEIATTVEDPHVPTVSYIYPTADWQERETYDMFGVIFDGHQALTRILMPDDWEGFPQRKDYPLGGIPVEYKGAQIPPPDQRRAYK